MICIVPKPVPTLGLIAFSAVLIAFFGGWMVLALCFIYGDRFAPAWELWIVCIAGPSICAFTIALCTGMISAAYNTDLRRGPWLVIDGPAGTVTLPRERRHFARSRVLRIEHVRGWARDERGRRDFEEERVELQLVVRADCGGEERLCVLRARAGVYRRLCRELAECSGVPLVNVRERLSDGEVVVERVGPTNGAST